MSIAVLMENEQTVVTQSTRANLENLLACDEWDGFGESVAAQSRVTMEEAQASAAREDQELTELLARRGFEVLDTIGAGGMGRVYRAVQQRMGRIVAIKALRESVRHHRTAVSRFERECRATARLQHPNIVGVYDAGDVEGIPYLVMQHVDGADLAAVVRQRGPLVASEVIDYVLQAARGLEFAHSQGVIHRDVKPSNLLVDQRGIVRILDLGLARIEDDTDVDGQAELTVSGMVLGTVDYMAPEQALDTRSADGRADIYSLGCTLFFLLTGRPAFEGESLTARLIAHQIQPAPDLRQHCPHATSELSAVFSRMVAKKVEDRYQSMSDVVADLARLAAAHALAG